MYETSPGQLHELRKEVRQLERELDSSLSQFGKLATRAKGRKGVSSSRHGGRREGKQRGGDAGDDESPIALQEQFTRESTHIRNLLNRLAQLLDEIQNCANNMDDPEDGVTHSLQRYHRILRDSSEEYKVLHARIHTSVQRAELFSDMKSSGSAVHAKTELLLREKDSLHSSIQMTDDLLDQALHARKELKQSRRMFDGIGGKVRQVGGAMPGVNKLIGKITRHKQKDTIVMAIVIASCMLFTMVYIYRS